MLVVVLVLLAWLILLLLILRYLSRIIILIWKEYLIYVGLRLVKCIFLVYPIFSLVIIRWVLTVLLIGYYSIFFKIWIVPVICAPILNIRIILLINLLLIELCWVFKWLSIIIFSEVRSLFLLESRWWSLHLWPFISIVEISFSSVSAAHLALQIAKALTIAFCLYIVMTMVSRILKIILVEIQYLMLIFGIDLTSILWSAND